MPKKRGKTPTKPVPPANRIINQAKLGISNWWFSSRWHRILAIFFAVLVGITLGMYVVAQWYIATNRHKPLQIGVTFVPNYARYLGLNPKETMTVMVDELGFKKFRLVSYWSNFEKKRGTYDFRELDWQFKMAEEKGLEISLAVGLRQPRWPECHMPKWAEELPKDEWYPELKKFMKVTVERYKNSPVLKSYQLENEFLLKVFGDCPDHDRNRLIDEFNYLKELDSSRPIVITRSNNATPSWPVGQPRPDISGAAVYKRVWDKTLTKRYFEYPLPAWYYAFLAGGAKLTTGTDTILHELQTEPWLPEGYDIRTASVEEQYQTFNPDILRDRLKYGVDTGMREIDVWGVEWWYYMKQKRGAPELWQTAKEELPKYR